MASIPPSPGVGGGTGTPPRSATEERGCAVAVRAQGRRSSILRADDCDLSADGRQVGAAASPARPAAPRPPSALPQLFLLLHTHNAEIGASVGGGAAAVDGRVLAEQGKRTRVPPRGVRERGRAAGSRAPLQQRLPVCTAGRARAHARGSS